MTICILFFQIKYFKWWSCYPWLNKFMMLEWQLKRKQYPNSFPDSVILKHSKNAIPPPTGPRRSAHRHFEAFSRLSSNAQTSTSPGVPAEVVRVPQDGQRQKLEVPAGTSRPGVKTDYNTSFTSSGQSKLECFFSGQVLIFENWLVVHLDWLRPYGWCSSWASSGLTFCQGQIVQQGPVL
jgi:hypothetical protein